MTTPKDLPELPELPDADGSSTVFCGMNEHNLPEYSEEDAWSKALVESYGAACAAHAREVALSDGEIAELVNTITRIAKEYHDHQSLRQRMSEVVVATLKAGK